MRLLLFVIAALVPLTGASAQSSQQPEPQTQTAQPGNYPRHLVMFAHPGPNFAKRRDNMAAYEEHQALWRRLAEEGYTIASGAFEGTPSMGMTIFSKGVDEARIRELIKDDTFTTLGIMRYEFRTYRVVHGALPAD